MKIIGLRELRLKTKEYRSALAKHEDVLILDRGRPYAILRALREGEVELQPVFKKKRQSRRPTGERRRRKSTKKTLKAA